MKKSILLASILFSATGLFAQQDPHLALYVFNPTMYNPSYAGNAQDPELSLAYRNQWQGIEGAPTTLFASGQSMLTDAFGGGLMLQSDQLGPIQMTSIATDLNYRIKVSEVSKLAVGLRLGMSNYNEALTDLYVIDPNDPIFQSDINQWNPMVGYGDGLRRPLLPELFFTRYPPNGAAFLCQRRFCPPRSSGLGLPLLFAVQDCDQCTR